MRLLSIAIATTAMLGATAASAQTVTRENPSSNHDSVDHFASWQSVQADVAALRRENAELYDRLSNLEASGFSTTASHSSECNVCAPTCRRACPDPGGFGAGGGIYYLKPHWENNPAYGIFVDAPGGTDIYSQVDLDWDAQPAWDVWLQYIGAGGGGLRSRFWQFDQGISHTDTFPATAGVNTGIILPSPYGMTTNVLGTPLPFTVQSGLEIQVIDLEALQTLRRGAWNWQFSGGLRWASVKQNYRIDFPIGQNLFLAFAHDFDGLGPLVTLQGRRSLFGSGLSLFGKARGAVLFGTSDETGTTGRDTINFGLLIDQATTVSRWDTIPVLELELGTTYSQPIGAVTAFVEAAFVGNVWLGAGNASSSSPLSSGAPTVINAFDQPTFGTDNNDNLGLIGGRLSAGLRY